MVAKSASGKAPKRGGLLINAFYILLLPVYLLAKFIPKNDKLYAFGSCHGQHFADNSKYLFLYASRRVRNIKCIFFSRNREVVKMLKDNDYNACYIFSLQGIINAIRAKKCFISHSTYDIHTLLIGGAEIYQLWHGTPLKRICYDVVFSGKSMRAKIKNSLRKILFAVFPYLNVSMNYNRLVVSSEYVRNNFKSAFRAKNDEIIVLGQARNDTMMSDFEFNISVFPEITLLNQLKKETDYIITWMPTHRLLSKGSAAGLLNSYSFNVERITDFLKEHNSRLMVKVHHLDRSEVKNIIQNNDRIIIYQYADPYPLLRYTDILMTDYSSVYFDYLLTNRPIIFTPFDYDDYVKNDASFYYDYDEITPGDKCYNWNDVIESLEKHIGCISDNQEDPYNSQRKKISELFNDYKGDNAKRIVEKLFPHR